MDFNAITAKNFIYFESIIIIFLLSASTHNLKILVIFVKKGNYEPIQFYGTFWERRGL